VSTRGKTVKIAVLDLHLCLPLLYVRNVDEIEPHIIRRNVSHDYAKRLITSNNCNNIFIIIEVKCCILLQLNLLKRVDLNIANDLLPCFDLNGDLLESNLQEYNSKYISTYEKRLNLTVFTITV
jgi:hypothetical protein